MKDMNKEDLYLDETLVRRIKRAEEAEREKNEASSDEEKERGDEMTVRTQSVKLDSDGAEHTMDVDSE